jgi:hypothetical protein
MSTMTQPCEYEKCNCMVTGGTSGAAYCSDICEELDDVEEEMEETCSCGHPPCDDSS